MVRILQKVKKKSDQLYMVFFSFALLLSFSIIGSQALFFSGSAQKVALHNGVKKLAEREQFFQSFLHDAEQNLISLRECKLFKDNLHSETSLSDLENIFQTYAKANPDFMQLRFIDTRGMERIRVNRTTYGGPVELTKQNALQDKSSRYYFSESKNRPVEQLWFSALDLNVERGAIETPYKPTLRAVYPVEHQGQSAGLLVINFFMQPFLEKLTNAPLYDMVLFNDNGDILHHYDANKSWSAYSELRTGIQGLHPEEAKSLLAQASFRSDSLVAKRLDVPVKGGVNVMLKLSQHYLDEEAKKSQNKYLITFLIVLLLSVLLTIVVVRLFKTVLIDYIETERVNTELKRESQRDELTRLHNRKAYNNRLQELLAETQRYHKVFSLAVIDIDDFKRVNDDFGHDIGDKLLVALGKYLKTSTRINDYVYRIGGEEFVVLMVGTELDKACHLCETLCGDVSDYLGPIEGRNITISIGVTEVNPSDSAESIFKRADEKLYLAKDNGKNQVSC